MTPDRIPTLWARFQRETHRSAIDGMVLDPLQVTPLEIAAWKRFNDWLKVGGDGPCTLHDFGNMLRGDGNERREHR